MGARRNKNSSNSKVMDSAHPRGNGVGTYNYLKKHNLKKEKDGKFLRESDFKRAVKTRLDKIKGLYYFIKEAAAIRGIPDIVIVYKGKSYFWELKRSKWEIFYKTKEGMNLHGRTALQWHTIQKIRKAGGIADFVYPENLEDKIRELL